MQNGHQVGLQVRTAAPWKQNVTWCLRSPLTRFPPVIITCQRSIKHTCEMQLVLHRLLVWSVRHACSSCFILLVWSSEHQLQLIPMLWTKMSTCNGSADTPWLTNADLIQYDLLYVCDLDFQNKGWRKDVPVGLVFFYWIVRAIAAWRD